MLQGWQRAYAKKMINNAESIDGCLICNLTPSQEYANVKWYGKAHRLTWEYHKGPIPEGLMICHSCDIRRCINIEHLFLGSAQDNMEDKCRKNRQHFGGPGKLLTDEQIKKAQDLYNGLNSYTEVGRILGVSRRTVARAIESISS